MRYLSLLEVMLVLIVVIHKEEEEERTAHRLPSCLARIKHRTIEKCRLTMVGQVKHPYISDRSASLCVRQQASDSRVVLFLV